MRPQRFHRQTVRADPLLPLERAIRHVRAVAVGARFRRRFIEKNVLVLDLSHEFMTSSAGHRNVETLQREVGALVVIEE
jgi:hypothetical protein